jgi:hypothetical protein
MRCAQLEEEIRRLRATNNQLRGVENPRPLSIEGEQVREVFDEWVEVCGHPRAKLTSDRRSKVRARLKEGYTSVDLKQAVRGAARGAYVDARGHKWDDLTLICRSGANVERFIALAGPDAKQLSEKFIA